MKIHQASKVTNKTILSILLNLFLFVLHLNFKQLRFSGEPMTQHTHQSHANMNPMGM